MKMRVVISLLSAGMLAACTTHLQSQKLPIIEHHSVDEITVPTGVVYYLPARAFNIQTNFIIKECTAKGRSITLPSKLNATVSSNLVADTEQRYVIPYEQLNRVTKVTDIDIKSWETGALKSINSTIDDRTMETATAVFSGIADIGIAAATRASGTVLYGYTDDRSPKPCEPFKEKLDRLKELKLDLTKAFGDREALISNDEEVRSRERAVAEARSILIEARNGGSEADIGRAERTLGEALKKLDKAEQNQSQSQVSKNVANLQTAIAKLEKELTFSKTTVWVPTGKKLSVETDITISKDEIARRFGLPSSVDQKPVTAQAQVTLAGGQHGIEQPDIKETVDGIVYRQPVLAKLQVCLDTCSSGFENVLIDETYTLPQFGDFAVLPLNNKVFDNNEIQVSFRNDGMLESLKYMAKSRSERAAKGFQSIAEQLAKSEEKRLNLSEKGLDLRQKKVSSELDYMETLAKLDAAGRGVTDRRESRNQQLDYDIQQTQKQAAYLKALKELLQAQRAYEEERVNIGQP